MKRLMIFGLLILCIVNASFSADNKEKRITHPIDIIGTGGAGVAGPVRYGSIFLNPASLALGDRSTFSILKIGASANWDLYELYKIYPKIDDTAEDLGLGQLTTEEWATLLNLRSKIGIIGPLSLGYIGNGIGILFYNNFVTTANVKQAPGLPYVDFGTYLDIGFTVGYGLEIPFPFYLGKYTKIYLGLGLNYLNRIKYENDRLSLVEAFDLGMSILSAERGLFMGQNISADVGMIISFGERLSAGFVVRDFFSTGFDWAEFDTNFQRIENSSPLPITYFYPAFDIGVGYSARIDSFVLSDLNLYFDIANALDFSENYFLKLRLGAEITLIKIFTIRAGLYQGYPTLGLSVNLPLVKINAAYYTEELGDLPGSDGQQTVLLEVELSI